MPRKKLIRTGQYYYHITTRSNHKHWFQIPLTEVWQISIESFQKAQKYHPAEISQYVLMNNHYHLLIRTPNEDIDKFMYFFNKTFSQNLRLSTGLENRMFGSNYKWSLIYNQNYFNNAFRYIYQNPLRAQVVSRCEDYPFSTLFYSIHKKQVPFPFKVIADLEYNLDFLNQRFKDEDELIISKALKKTVYSEVSGRAR